MIQSIKDLLKHMLNFKNEKALLSLLICLGFFSSNTTSRHDAWSNASSSMA